MKVPLLRRGTFHMTKGPSSGPFRFEISPEVDRLKVKSKI